MSGPSVPNNITDAGLNFIRGLLSGQYSDGRILFFAVGSSSAANNDSQVNLGAEFFRKAITERTDAGAGALTTDVLLTSAEANGQIEEVGWFAGPDASTAANSGIMVARVLYSKAKTINKSIEFSRLDTFTEV